MMQNATLRSGAHMPRVGLGTWQLSASQVGPAVHAALQAGYRHLDCASIYNNEAAVGEVLERDVGDGEGAVCSRGELFVTSKLWNSAHAAADVEVACRKSLQDLRLDYLDLYLIHWPVTGKKGPTLTPPTKETWAAMEGLVSLGLVRSIGVANFSICKLQDLLATATIPPSVNQVEMHPFLRQDELMQFCHQHDVVVIAYSPLGSPGSDFGKAAAVKPLADDTVQSVAQAAGKSPAQVLLRWALQRGTDAVIPKSATIQHIIDNLKVFDFHLSDEHMAMLSSFSLQTRVVHGSFFLSKAGPYKQLADLWDE